MTLHRIPSAEYNSHKHTTPPPVNQAAGYVVSYDTGGHHDIVRARGGVRVSLYTSPFGFSAYQTVVIPETCGPHRSSAFCLNPDSPSGFDLLRGAVAEPLSTLWWLYSAARYYRDVLCYDPAAEFTSNPIAAILLGHTR